MKLPNARRAVVERSKIVDYLLNASHPGNNGKAAYFESRGFSSKGWRYLAGALLHLARTVSVQRILETPHGTKYILDGPLPSPSGKLMAVRTTWMVHADQTHPNFVTAVPLRLNEDD